MNRPHPTRHGGLSVRSIVLLASVVFSLAQLPLPERRPAPNPQEGHPIVQRLLARAVPAESSEVHGLLKVRDMAGRRWEIPVVNTIVPDDAGWKSIYETRPVSQRLERLVIVHRKGESNQYFRDSGIGSGDGIDAMTRLSGDALYSEFASSDFWVADLGLEFLHWPEQRLVDREYRKTRFCNVVESINPSPAPGAYARVVSWITDEEDGLIQAKAYDQRGNLMKVFSVGELEKVDGRWRVRELQIRNEQSDSRTALAFNFDVEVEKGAAGTRPIRSEGAR